MANLILHKRMSIAQYNTFKTLHTVNGVLDDEFKNTLFVLNETGTFTGTSDCIFYMGEHLLSYASYKKALSLSASSTDNQFPTAKCVYDAVKDKADSATTLSGYGITDAYTKTEIDAKLTTVYKAAGSAATVSALGSLDAQHEGFVYNMSAAFETTSNFVEGAGKSYPVGTNVVIVNTGTIASPVYKYDILAGETFKPSINITWSALKNLRDNGNLVPGTWYRITDYTCTTTQTDTQSAGHVFDIIVRADAVNKLNENAYATHHSGDTYFTNCKLEAWELKYCIDNDTNRFAWADSTNGKGVIFYMKDEWNNECPYDFKNIMFKRWAITAYTKTPSLVVDNANNTYGFYYGTKFIEATGNIIANATYGDSSAFFYTFALKEISSGNYYDFSVENSRFIKKGSEVACCYGNSFSNPSDFYNDNDKIQILSNNVFYAVCTNLSYGTQTNQEVLSHLFNNKFIGLCYDNTFGNNCNNNVSDGIFSWNVIGNDCNQNKFAGRITTNTIGNDSNYNVIGSFWGNTAGDTFRGNVIGNFVYYNNFGNRFRLNDLSGGCIDHCEFINETLGSIFGTGCQYIKFLKENMCCNIIGANNKNITITSNQTTSQNMPLSNIIIAPRTNCELSQEKIISHDIPPVSLFQNAPLYTYQPANSQTISV